MTPGRAVKNLQSVSLLGIRSHLQSISYAFQLMTYLKYGGTVIKKKWTWNRTQGSLKCKLFIDFLQNSYSHFRRLNTVIYLESYRHIHWYFSLPWRKLHWTLFYNNRVDMFELRCHYFRVNIAISLKILLKVWVA